MPPDVAVQTPASMRAFKTITECRVCCGKKLIEVWDGGYSHVVEFPVIGEKPKKPKAPLCLVLCEECKLLQLRDSVNPAFLYQEFWYRSGTNEMMRDALYDVVQSIRSEVLLQGGDSVLDIGCNDGTLLLCYPIGLHCIGMDPAKNLQPVGQQPGGWTFVNDYFSAEKSRECAEKKYKAVTAIACFYDLDDPVGFCEDVKQVLAKDGVFVVQMNYLLTMLQSSGVDNICHEHLTYFSLSSLMLVFEAAGLSIYKAEVNSVNGGSLRVYARHTEKKQSVDESVARICLEEQSLRDFKTYSDFRNRVKFNLSVMDDFIDQVSKLRQRVFAYGASTRGTALLQLLTTGQKLTACAERDTRKIGRYIVGANIPIISEGEFRSRAEFALVLPWHFLPAIVKREAEWLDKGGKMLVPLPKFHVLSKDDV